MQCTGGPLPPTGTRPRSFRTSPMAPRPLASSSTVGSPSAELCPAPRPSAAVGPQAPTRRSSSKPWGTHSSLLLFLSFGQFALLPHSIRLSEALLRVIFAIDLFLISSSPPPPPLPFLPDGALNQLVQSGTFFLLISQVCCHIMYTFLSGFVLICVFLLVSSLILSCFIFHRSTDQYWLRAIQYPTFGESFVRRINFLPQRSAAYKIGYF